MSVKTLYEYRCDCCGHGASPVERGPKIPELFVGVKWVNSSLGLTDVTGESIMHLCSNCHEALGDLYKREMATKEENEG